MRSPEEILRDVCGEDHGLLSSTAILPAIEQAQRELVEEAVEIVRKAYHAEMAEDELRKLLPHREGQ